MRIISFLLFCLMLVMNYSCSSLNDGSSADNLNTENTSNSTGEEDEDVIFFNGDTINVAYQDTVFLTADQSSWMTFDALVNESRCPVDVLCITAGNAEITIAFSINSQVENVNLNTDPDLATGTTVFDYRISLIDLTPYPHTENPHNPGNYVAKLAVSKIKSD